MDNKTSSINGLQETQAFETFPLDDAAIEVITQLDQQERDINIARNATLNYFARQHKLQGEWQLGSNRRELIRRETSTASL